MAERGIERLPDWLVIGQEDWDDIERRNQLLVKALAERHPGSRFLFSELPRRPRAARSWRLPRPRQVGANIWCVRAIRPLPDRGRLGRISDRIEAAQLRRALRMLAIEDPAIWTQDPRAAALVELLPAQRLVYDLTDDWAAFEPEPAQRAAVQERIERLGARAELVLACSRPLERGAHTWSKHDRVLYLPNAVDPPSDPDPMPREIAGLSRPLLGYAGTLHSSRLDVDLLVQTAQMRPSWSFAFLGPDQLELDDRERLLGLPNVHHLGVRPHAYVRGYLEAFDVCLLPHRVTEFTRSLDPLKLYEYLAAGRPVVMTPTGNAPELERHVVSAATAEELVREAEHAMAVDGPEAAAARRAAVADSTWEARAAEIERALGISPGPAGGGATVSAVIVSYNTRDLLDRCLRELERQQEVELQTIVVDNGSSDGSVELVRTSFPNVELVALDENAGFARANNIAFERCNGEYVLLLNSDAFLAPDALAELVGAARRHPRAGAVGARLLNPDGTLQRSAWPFPDPRRLMLEAFLLHRLLRRLGVMEDLHTWAHDEERPVDFLIGACLLLRRDALAEAGGFDERFWLYGEEADLQRRMAARGWNVILAPGATATHVGGASSGVSETRLRHFYLGQKRFLSKHRGPLAWPLARLALLIGSVLRGRWSAARLAAGRRL